MLLLPVAVLVIGLFCWLLFSCAIYALPFYVGVNVALMAAHHGTGAIPIVVEGFAAAVITHLVGHLLFSLPWWPIRVAAWALFAMPAAIAGWSCTVGILNIFGFDPLAAKIAGAAGALLVGIAALARLGSLPKPEVEVRPNWVIL